THKFPTGIRRRTERAEGSQPEGRGTACREGLRPPDPELLHSGLQGGRLHSEERGGAPRAADPPSGDLEHPQDVLPLDLLQGPDGSAVGARAGGLQPGARIQARPLAQDDGPLDDVLELSNVPGPRVGPERGHGRIGDARNPLAQTSGIPMREVPDQERDVLGPFPKWRYTDREDAQAVVEVGAKHPGPDGLSQITV